MQNELNTFFVIMLVAMRCDRERYFFDDDMIRSEKI